MKTIQKYLAKKLYNIKKTIIAIVLCIAATLALTGCGAKETSNDDVTETVQNANIYRFTTEDGYHDFNIINTDEYEYKGSMRTRYYTEEGYIITFSNTGCTVYLSRNDYNDENLAATYTDASMKKIDMPITWEKVDEEVADTTLDYEITEPEKEITPEI